MDIGWLDRCTAGYLDGWLTDWIDKLFVKMVCEKLLYIWVDKWQEKLQQLADWMKGQGSTVEDTAIGV